MILNDFVSNFIGRVLGWVSQSEASTECRSLTGLASGKEPRCASLSLRMASAFAMLAILEE